MKRGTQVILIPLHAKGDPDHPDCIRGIVTSEQPMGATVFCHFWAEIGVSLRPYGSRATDVSRLVALESIEQSIVDALLVGAKG